MSQITTIQAVDLVLDLALGPDPVVQEDVWLMGGLAGYTELQNRGDRGYYWKASHYSYQNSQSQIKMNGQLMKYLESNGAT